MGAQHDHIAQQPSMQNQELQRTKHPTNTTNCTHIPQCALRFWQSQPQRLAAGLLKGKCKERSPRRTSVPPWFRRHSRGGGTAAHQVVGAMTDEIMDSSRFDSLSLSDSYRVVLEINITNIHHHGPAGALAAGTKPASRQLESTPLNLQIGEIISTLSPHQR